MNRNKYVYIVLFLFLIITRINAQSDCSSRLKTARELFESGQIEQIPALLDSCLIDGFDKKQENQAYVLLLQTYLFDYNRDKAMEVMLSFLKKYPEYQFTTEDPIEIKEILESFTVNPNWGFGLSAGLTLSQVSSFQNFSVYNLNNLTTVYNQKLGFSSSLFVEKFFGKHVGLSAGLGYRTISYENKEISGDNLSQTLFNETSSWFSFPIRFSCNFGSKRFSPFIFCGGELNFLSNTIGKYTYSVGSETNRGEKNLVELRNPFQYSVMGGLGLRYRIPKGFFKLWIGYNYSFANYINSGKRYSDSENYLDFGHIDDDIKFDNFFLTITYTRNLYKIKVKSKNVEK